MQFAPLLVLLAAVQGAMANPVLEKRFIELALASVTTPNALFPANFAWQHQSNAIIEANAAAGILANYSDASAALRNLRFQIYDIPDFFITNATMLPPSGSAHDFLSYAPYYWPNTTCPDTCAWINRDGVINPDILSLTQQSDLNAMTNSVRTSTLTEYYFGPYWGAANSVAQQLATWFINPATRMNPNVDYGQIVRQANASAEFGRYEGILSTRQLVFIPTAVEMVRSRSSAWTAANDAAIVEWATEYLAWILAPPFSMKFVNNHRTYWSCQVVEFQRFLGQHDVATATLDSFVKTYLPGQINSIGNQTLEFSRTRPVHYAMFNLDALIYLAQFAEQTRPDTNAPYYDFWGAQNNAIKLAFDFVLDTTTIADVEVEDVDMLIRITQVMYTKYGDATGKYAALLAGLGAYQEPSFAISPLFASS